MATNSPQERPGERRQRVQSVEMGMVILKGLAHLGGIASLTALSQEVGESTAKVHRYLASLSQEGLVAQESSTQRYFLAAEAIQIGLAALRQCDPIRMGEMSLVHLREELQATCFLAIMGNMGPTILRFEEPGLPVTINVRTGSVLPMLWSATGRAFLGYLDDANVDSMVLAELASATPEQLTSLAASDPISQLREETQAAGYATIRDTLLRGISAVSAPIFDHTNKVCAVLTALGAVPVFDIAPSSRVVAAVVREAASISTSLGYKAR